MLGGGKVKRNEGYVGEKKRRKKNRKKKKREGVRGW